MTIGKSEMERRIENVRKCSGFLTFGPGVKTKFRPIDVNSIRNNPPGPLAHNELNLDFDELIGAKSRKRVGKYKR